MISLYLDELCCKCKSVGSKLLITFTDNKRQDTVVTNTRHTFRHTQIIDSITKTNSFVCAGWQIGQENAAMNKLVPLLYDITWGGQGTDIDGGFDPASLLPGLQSHYLRPYIFYSLLLLKTGLPIIARCKILDV